MDANQVSLQAFQEEVSNWQLTLQRETKKLKQLRNISKNKFQLNSIDITLIEIEYELIQYKKIRDKVMQPTLRNTLPAWP
jgi:urease alpha subunit